jgi:hypothetical protein
MPQVQQTLTITIDDNIFEVANMSPEVQSAVMYMDEWRQKEADLTSKLLMVRAALNDVQNTLLKTIQAEAAAANQVTEVVEPTPTAKQ